LLSWLHLCMPAPLTAYDSMSRFPQGLQVIGFLKICPASTGFSKNPEILRVPMHAAGLLINPHNTYRRYEIGMPVIAKLFERITKFRVVQREPFTSTT
jgi:hypothetical protein